MLKPISAESTNRFCGLVIAVSGMGKTSLIRTVLGQEYDSAAQKWVDKQNGGADKVCVISAESGLLCLRDLVMAGKVEGFEVETLDDFKAAYNLLATDAKMQERYSWVFVDSLTEISDRANKHFKEKYPDKAKTYDRWDDYALTLSTLIKGFRDMTQYNVIFTCLPSIDKDDNNRKVIFPLVTGRGIRDLLVSFFDEVFYMESFNADDGSAYRAFITQPYDRYPAKDRSGQLQMIEKPDLLYLRDRILSIQAPF